MTRNTNAIVTLLLILATILPFAGCGGYPEVSPKTYEIAKVLYRVCNQKESGRLDAVAGLIDKSLAAGEITADEADWLNDIVADGRSGDWDDASAEVRELMEDQVVH